jgi:uncharacterized protein
MMSEHEIAIEKEFVNFIENKSFPCIGAKTAIAKSQLNCLVVGHIFCPVDDEKIVTFLHTFIDKCRTSNNQFHSAAIIFSAPQDITEAVYEIALWQRLQAISNIDAQHYKYDSRVSLDIHSSLFSFSIKEEALFIVGMHGASSRDARRFKYPAIVFNPHAQFEILKQTNKYKNLQSSIRKRDMALSGTINPMLSDHAIAMSLEIVQYSGKDYGNLFSCPLIINHATL